MKYIEESHKAWIVRTLQELAETIAIEHGDNIEHISAINYVIGYLIGIGWGDNTDVTPKTKEAAIYYLHDIGWLQEHDNQIKAGIEMEIALREDVKHEADMEVKNEQSSISDR